MIFIRFSPSPNSTPATSPESLHRTGHPTKSDVLIIGDSLTSDMQGGVDYGLATCWYYLNGEPRLGDLGITYEIRQLRELLELLE